MIIRTTLQVILVALAIVFIAGWRRAATREGRSIDAGKRRPSLIQIVIGFVTDFFDTLGIGSFATTSTAFKMMHLVPDERIVGTMLIGHSIPVDCRASSRPSGARCGSAGVTLVTNRY